jgi:SAM-dependent methyltransferase
LNANGPQAERDIPCAVSMDTNSDYDAIGRGYSLSRMTDPRIAREIVQALGDATTVVNVGAGTGSYEPRHLKVVAVEPSIEMIGQRPTGAAPVVRAVAEQLPFADHCFDASLAVLTIHHWRDLLAGLAEMRRVARRRVVILTWDIAAAASFWLTAHYFPEITAFDSTRFEPISELAHAIGGAKVITVPVPRDCEVVFWRRFGRGPKSTLILVVARQCRDSPKFHERLPKAALSGWLTIFRPGSGIADSVSCVPVRALMSAIVF